jgi:hypothetical protein
MSGGGGTTSTQTTSMPTWLEDVAKTQLGKATALTDINDNPYQQYGGQRIAGFNPMQQNYFQGVENLGTSGAVGQGIDIAGQAAQRGLNTQTFGADQASQYMSPYMQNVVDIQKREAARQSGIQGTQQQAQAAQAGAFGGGRDAIMRAERERNLGQQMNDIQERGSQAAFTNAQGQFNADQSRGIQGLQTALSGASQLGGLGSTQFGQQKDILSAQQAVGSQQQAQEQAGLSQGYEDFLNKQKYPYQQLEFLQNIVRGTPYGSTTSMYSPGASAGAQLLGAGTSLAGAAMMGGWKPWGAKEGGLASAYAAGGSVDSEENIEDIVRKLSDLQLDQAEQMAKARGDTTQMQVIGMEKAARASMKRGVAAAPVNMEKMLPTEESMARGGIVAFSRGGANDGDEGEEEARNYMARNEDDDTGGGEYAGYPTDIAGSISALQKLKYKAPTPEERAAEFRANRERLMQGVDTSERDSIRADIQRMQEESEGDLRRGQGLALLRFGAGLFKGGDLGNNISESAAAASQVYGDAIRANQAKKSALQNMRINLAESQRKEQMGLNREAIALQDQARKDGDAAQKFEVDRLRAIGVLEGAKARANKANTPKPPGELKVAEQLAAAEIAAAKNPNDKEAQLTVKALRATIAQAQQKVVNAYGVQDFGPTRAGLAGSSQNANIEKDIDNAVNERLKQDMFNSKSEYRKALTSGDTVAVDNIRKKYADEIRERYKTVPPMAPTKSDAGKTPPPSGAGKTAPVINPADFDAKWAKLKSGESLVGPDGKTYTKK